MSDPRYRIISDRWSRDEAIVTLAQARELAAMFAVGSDPDEPRPAIIESWQNGERCLRDQTGSVIAVSID